MYFLEKQYMDSEKPADDLSLINPYSIIFSLNPTDDSNIKKSYNGLAFVFYYSRKYKNINHEVEGLLYIPVAYVILSEFPYFYHFKQICLNIIFQMKKENDEIPIDIFLYNLVKYCPSPINKSIYLSFGVELGNNLNKKITINEILDSLNEANVLTHKIKGIPSLFFNQLSGYPILDLNLRFIFNIIPCEIICQVFIFSFLEYNIIFYSKEHEILNNVMYIFSNLNYPFIDSEYYQNIFSSTEESFISDSFNLFRKKGRSLIGILGKYNPENLIIDKIKEYFVVDIGNKSFFLFIKKKPMMLKKPWNYAHI